MDGDGSVVNFVHAPTRKTYPKYRYERLGVAFHSASRTHIDWLRERLVPIAASKGYVRTLRVEGRHDFYQLGYGKAASTRLLSALYADPSSPRLIRKWLMWSDYVRRANAA
jgi:hypothetical protein